jgi:hypothetical protein
MGGTQRCDGRDRPSATGQQAAGVLGVVTTDGGVEQALRRGGTSSTGTAGGTPALCACESCGCSADVHAVAVVCFGRTFLLYSPLGYRFTVNAPFQGVGLMGHRRGRLSDASHSIFTLRLRLVSV